MIKPWHSRCCLEALLLLLGGCGEQFADPIRMHCEELQTPEQCAAYASQGCLFQPNLVGCRSDNAACLPGICTDADAYVRRSGEQLTLHGNPYRFLGAVTWGVAGFRTPCHFPSDSSSTFEQHAVAVERAFDELVDMKVDVLKFWAYQKYAGPNGDDFSSFDLVVKEARRASIRLIPVLESMWQDCTEGADSTLSLPRKPDSWFTSGYKAPYGSYRYSFPEYVSRFVSHYRDEPTILAFEIMHEAQGSAVGTLDGFVSEMVSVVRQHAPQHLIVAGLDNGQSTATSSNLRYRALNSNPEIGLIDIHDFGNDRSTMPTNGEALWAIAHELRKPWFIGAAAVRLGKDAAGTYLFAERGQLVENKLNAVFAPRNNSAQGVGFLLYDYQPGWSTPDYPFDVREGEVIGELLRAHDIANP